MPIDVSSRTGVLVKLLESGREIAHASERVLELALARGRSNLFDGVGVHRRRDLTVDGLQEPKRQIVVILALAFWAASVDAVEVATEQAD